MSAENNLIVPAPEWSSVRCQLGPGTILVIGKPDRGKTWLVRYLAGELAKTRQKIAVLSSDMGQASVGVPTCLGLSLAAPWHEPAASWFIGDTTPVGHLLPTVAGTAQLAQHARRLQVQILLIDTSGLVDGPLGRVLKYHKAVMTGVDHLVALQQGSELEPLLALLQGPCRTIHRLRPAAQARERSASERRHYRELQLQAHFHGGAVVGFEPSQLLNLDWTPGPNSESRAPSPGTVVGLLDPQGFCLSLGLLEQLQPGRLLIFTRWRDRNAVRWVQVGKIRLSSQGVELPR